MKKLRMVVAASACIAGLPLASHANTDFTGLLESRPAGQVGTWRIGGQSVEVTANTRLDEDDGPLKVGACVSVDFDGAQVEELESERPNKCRQRSRP